MAPAASGGGGGAVPGGHLRAHGKTMRMEPMKPMWKAPGTKRLKKQRDKLLLVFAFNFDLCRYMMALDSRLLELDLESPAAAAAIVAGFRDWADAAAAAAAPGLDPGGAVQVASINTRVET
jgi:hypothetical protein